MVDNKICNFLGGFITNDIAMIIYLRKADENEVHLTILQFNLLIEFKFHSNMILNLPIERRYKSANAYMQITKILRY